MYQEEDKATGIAGVPLTPKFLAKVGAMTAPQSAPGDFEPGGAWTHAYRIFACHGYVDEGNGDVGFLKLERVPQGGDRFLLKVTQRIVQNGGPIQALDAELRCRADALASPVEWKLESRLRDDDGKELADLSGAESGRLGPEGIEIVRRGHTARQKFSGRVTADFAMFEAVQRLPFTKASPLTFDLLEGLSLYRPGHRLSYDGILEAGLHRFHHLGHGVGPYEYWVDPQHVLRLVVTHARAYIFDDKAEDVIRRQMEAEQERARRRAGRKGKK